MSLTRIFTSSAPWVIGREALFADATEDFLHEMTRQRPWLRVRYESLLGKLSEALDAELQVPAPLTALTPARSEAWLQQVDIAERPMAESVLNAFADYLVKWGWVNNHPFQKIQPV